VDLLLALLRTLAVIPVQALVIIVELLLALLRTLAVIPVQALVIIVVLLHVLFQTYVTQQEPFATIAEM
jgi:hypothetical protein